MCDKYPGLRCGNKMHERVESLTKQVEEAKAFRDVLDPNEVTSSDITDANRRVTVLENRLKETQAKYDATDAGFRALEAAAQDESLSDAERTELKVRLKDAANQRAEREKAVSDSEARRANVMAYLEQAGVPANERADFDDTNIFIAASGSAKHYETIKNNRMKAYEARLAECNRALAKAKTPAETAKVEANESLAVSKAKSDFNRALFRFDATAQGIEALKAKVAKAAVCYIMADVVKRKKLEIRLSNAERAHRVNLDSRNYRNSKLAQLKAVVSAHGGDVEGAVKAFKNKSPLPKSAKRRVPLEHQRSSTVYAHLTEQDMAAIDNEFRQSDEYKVYGERGMSRFMERKVMVPVEEYYLRESVDEADARVVIASNGKVGRNNTVIDPEKGTAFKRNQKVSIWANERTTSILKSRAAFFDMTVSSYISEVALGRNVAARANDRSAAHRARKHAKMSQIVMEGIKAA